MNKDSRIYVAGHRGMVGSAIVRKLRSSGYENLVLRTSTETDLRDMQAVEQLFKAEKPEYVFLAAAKVGGIHANNTFRADFIYDNLSIELNVVHAAYRYSVRKLLFLGSSCIYPKDAPQPLKEEYLLSGQLESTNEPYAVAKIAGIKLCEAYRDQYGCDFISAMPTNLYGPNDNYDLESSHVIPALIRKFHEAKQTGKEAVTVWGSGKPLREFLHADDLAAACVFLMERYSDRRFLNIGYGKDYSISELAKMISDIVGFRGRIEYDPARPDGTFRKLLESSRLFSMGWKPSISLEEGLRSTYVSFQESEASGTL
jgi:GDP-L-fucose synthase